MFTNSGDPDQMPHSDLGLQCMPMSPQRYARLIWDNNHRICGEYFVREIYTSISAPGIAAAGLRSKAISSLFVVTVSHGVCCVCAWSLFYDLVLFVISSF